MEKQSAIPSIIITPSALMAVCHKVDKQRAEVLAALMNEIGPKYGVDTPLRMRMFVAQCAHESGQFSTKTESLNYSVEGLKKTFSYYRKNPQLAMLHGRTATRPADQVSISNTVYNDANRDEKRKLGNTQPGDGWLLRGGGFIQTTGRGMFTEYARYVKMDIKTIANLVRTDDRWAMDNAFWVFSIQKKLLDEADRGDVKGATIKINGGLNGLDERMALYEKCERFITK